MNSNSYLEDPSYPSYPSFPNDTLFIYQPSEPKNSSFFFSKFAHFNAE